MPIFWMHHDGRELRPGSKMAVSFLENQPQALTLTGFKVGNVNNWWNETPLFFKLIPWFSPKGTWKVIDDSNFCRSRDAAKCHLDASLFGTLRERMGRWLEAAVEKLCAIYCQMILRNLMVECRTVEIVFWHVSYVPGSKLPLFPYNRGWSSTQ